MRRYVLRRVTVVAIIISVASSNTEPTLSDRTTPWSPYNTVAVIIVAVVIAVVAIVGSGGIEIADHKVIRIHAVLAMFTFALSSNVVQSCFRCNRESCPS